MKAHLLIAAAAASLGLTGVAHAATAPADAKNATRNCFLSRDWQDWRGATPDKIYFRINIHDIYQVDLSGGSNMVTDPSNHLISHQRGSSWICGPLDLDLKISDGHIIEPLFVKALTKLTPEQVALIPKKDLP
jgi:hypothetical protein